MVRPAERRDQSAPAAGFDFDASARQPVHSADRRDAHRVRSAFLFQARLACRLAANVRHPLPHARRVELPPAGAGRARLPLRHLQCAELRNLLSAAHFAADDAKCIGALSNRARRHRRIHSPARPFPRPRGLLDAVLRAASILRHSSGTDRFRFRDWPAESHRCLLDGICISIRPRERSEDCTHDRRRLPGGTSNLGSRRDEKE